MENEKIKNWILSVEDNTLENKTWLELEDHLQTLLAPIRKNLLEKNESISELNDTIKALSRELSFYKEALMTIPNAIFIKDSETRFRFFNKKYDEIFGIDSSPNIGKKVWDLNYLPLEDRIRYQEEDEKMIEENSTVHYEFPFLFSDGLVHESLYWSKGFTVPETGEQGLLGEIVDISKEKELALKLQININLLKEANKKIALLSKTDTLTRLYNRSILDDYFSEVTSNEPNNLPLSILIIDLDHFKLINDTYGHVTGDKVLKKAGEILKKNSRSNDMPVRYGGEEFLIFLPLTSLEKAKKFGERLCSTFRNESILPNENITISVGAAQYKKGETLENFIKRADKALYIAKNSGRDRVYQL